MLREVRELSERFGIPAKVFRELSCIVGQGTVFCATAEVMRFDAVRPMRRGIRLCRIFPHSVKPTSWAMQVLGRHATRNCIDLDREQVVRLAAGEQLEIDAEAANGFVLVRCAGFTVGVGLYKRPALKTQLPKHRPVEQ